jgi:3-hydroxy-9,10-secoandrosta-1,3,5(10)-triene-9,17-dione monooxygenase
VLDLYEGGDRQAPHAVFPIVPMREHPQYARFLGEAVQLVDVAEGALLSSDRDYMEWCRRDVEEGTEFTPELDARLRLRKQLCSKLAADAVDLMVRTAGSSPLKAGSMLQRYQRDMTMLMTHNTAQPELAAESYGRMQLGVPPVGVAEGSAVGPVR